MPELHEKIRQKRVQLHLSQDQAAKALGVSRSTFTQMENGNRKILAEEIAMLAELYGVSADSLLFDSVPEETADVFIRSFERLDETDRAEIMNMIRFKEQNRGRKDR